MQSFLDFRNVRIPVKFIIALLLLCVGLIFMSASYYQTIILQEKAQQRTDELNNMLLLVSQLRAEISEARFEEKSFQIERNEDELLKFGVVMDKIEQDITDLQQYLRTEEDKKFVQQSLVIIDNYKDIFYETSSDILEVGKSSEDGLAGQLKLEISETSKLIAQLQDLWLQENYNEMRLAIDGFISDEGAGASVEALQAQVSEVETQLRTFGFSRNESARQKAVENMGKISGLINAIDTAITRSAANFERLQAILDSLVERIQQVNEFAVVYNAENERLQKEDFQKMATFFLGSMGLMIIAMAISLSIVKYSVIDPIGVVQRTINRVREGEDGARSQLDTQDELGQLSSVLDNLLEEKEKALELKDLENKRLNSSIITLIQNVFQISQKDLTVRVPVAEDVTGAVSDSINQLVESISSVLNEVNAVSERVNTTSGQVKKQSETVLSYAEREQNEISETLTGLDSAIKAMELISKLAVLSNNASQKAIKTSETAMDSVSQTIDSINKIRQTIHEAEKRIKRLGERSQEIGGIVNLINNISERTHVLSLNASMHAASAGEAGRGLMVVVDEVQRLAENSREATSEIESLVNNIQLETADTINVINNVITDVVEGTRLAEEAGDRMGETRATTQTLVDSVMRIAQSSVKQARVAETLRERATSIDETTQATNAEMQQQAQLSDDLVDAAGELQKSVSVFKMSSTS